jgi:RimJ/RimL family protein N-acetyltransferase
MGPGLRFLEKHGFVEEERTYESRLRLSRFDPDRFQGSPEQVARGGTRIRRLSELGSMDDWAPDFHDLVVSLEEDMPAADRYTPSSLADMRRVWFEAPHFRPDDAFVAEVGGGLIGACNLERDPVDGEQTQTGVTGVRSAYRRRGIARALKVAGLAHAQEMGLKIVRTHNDSTNQAMLALNEGLGFTRHGVWIGMARHLGS